MTWPRLRRSAMFTCCVTLIFLLTPPKRSVCQLAPQASVWLLHYQARLCRRGWTSLKKEKKKKPSLRLCTLLGHGEQYSRHRGTDWVAAALWRTASQTHFFPPPLDTRKLTLTPSFCCLLCCWRTKLFQLSCGIQDDKQWRGSLDIGGRDIKGPLLSGALAGDARDSSLELFLK